MSVHNHVLTATCIRRPRNISHRLVCDAATTNAHHNHYDRHYRRNRHQQQQHQQQQHRREQHHQHPKQYPSHHLRSHSDADADVDADVDADPHSHRSSPSLTRSSSHPHRPVATAIPSAAAARNSLSAVAAKARSSLRDIAQSNSVKYLIAGAIAGIVSRTAVSPLEVVATVNMCSSGATPPLLQQLRRLLATEGLRGFFKGNTANCLKVAPTKGIQFVAFEALKRLIHRVRHRHDPADLSLSSSSSASSSTSSSLPPPPALVASERFFAGGMAGIIAATLCYPLDTAKTLLTAHPERFRGVFSTISSITRNQGPVALYRGLSPTLVAMMPYAGLDFAIYEQLKLFYLRRNKKEANLFILLFIGAFAGAVAQTACHPLDVVRKRLQLQGINGRPVQYKTMVDAAVGIVRNEGVGSLYRGLQPMYISAIPSAGVSYVVYEAIKKFLNVRSFQ